MRRSVLKRCTFLLIVSGFIPPLIFAESVGVDGSRSVVQRHAKVLGSPNPDEVSVTDFGAVPNDSVDDVRGIQAAVDAGARIVFVPAGVYEISKGIELPSNIQIRGAGKYLTTIRARNAIDENFSWQPKLNGLYSGGLFKATAKENIAIRSVGFDGNRVNQHPDGAAANLLFSKCSHVEISDVYSANSMMDSITFLGGRYNAVINSITENNGYSGISTGLAQSYLDQEMPDYPSQSEYFVATGNKSNNDGINGASAISINGRWSVVFNNHIVKAGLAGVVVGHSLGSGSNGRVHTPPQDASGSVISNNNIEEVSVISGLEGAGVALGYVANGVVISGNTINKSYGYGISAGQKSTAVGAMISNNKIISTSGSGVFLGGALSYVLKDNSILSCGTGTLVVGGGLPKVVAGIYINSSAAIIADQFGIVEGNAIEGCGSEALPATTGVYVIYSREVRILRNQIGGAAGSSAYMKQGIFVDASAQQIEVISNTFYPDTFVGDKAEYVVVRSRTAIQSGNRIMRH